MNSGSNSVRTLKGVFDVPKMNHRRDFLRENKLNLRELQKNTTQKLTQRKMDQERQENKHLLRYQKSQEQFVPKRSNSHHRLNGEDLRQKPQQRAFGGVDGSDAVAVAGTEPGDPEQPNSGGNRRSQSQQREYRENLQPSYPTQNYEDNNYPTNPSVGGKELRVHRSASAASIISKAESCNKEIQTEDILDEEFLYDALKKCSSTDIGFRNKQYLREEEHNGHNPSYTKYEDTKSTHSRDNIQYEYRENGGGDNQYNDYNNMQHNGHHNIHGDNHLDEHMHNMHIDAAQAGRESEARFSARSRQTVISNVSKKKNTGSHVLGNREDLRLPRYLEKEKRVKEEERIREMSRDPNCPMGHYVMAEGERLAALSAAQKKMASLIQELNHMPMTTETLRIRTRKVEIENELKKIEVDIRTFSKPKVYVKAKPSISSLYF